MIQISDKEVKRLSSLVVSLQDLLAKLESRGVTLAPEMAKRIEDFEQKQICIKCENALVAGRDTRRKVMHQQCYNEVWRWIKEGKMTEQQAADDGIWNPTPEKPGRKGRYSKAVKKGLKLKKVGTSDGTRSRKSFSTEGKRMASRLIRKLLPLR